MFYFFKKKVVYKKRIIESSTEVCAFDLEKMAVLKRARAGEEVGSTQGGGWLGARKTNPRARVAGIDLLACEPIEGVAILEMDLMDDAAPDALIAALGRAPDLVLSDMAANTVGHSQTDPLRPTELPATPAAFPAPPPPPTGPSLPQRFPAPPD